MEINEYQSSEAPIQGNDRPVYDYTIIQDRLGNYYDAEITKSYLEEFEEEIPVMDRDTEEFYINRFKEWNREKFRLVPPFEDDLQNTRDFNAEYGWQSMTEDASVAVSGMGAVVTPTASSVPGQTIGGGDVGSSYGEGGIVGSGDIGSGWSNRNISPRPISSRRKKKVMQTLKKMNKSKAGNAYDKKLYKDAGKAKAHVMPFSDFVKKNKK